LFNENSGQTFGEETSPNNTETKGIIITIENKEKKTYKRLKRILAKTYFL
jgi:hypothetical protein